MTIIEISNKIESINEQINALNAQKSALRNELERIRKEEEAKRKEEQDTEYKTITDMIDNYNKKYNSNLAIFKYYESKAKDYPNELLNRLNLKWWEDV